jgi:hypothetical protein
MMTEIPVNFLPREKTNVTEEYQRSIALTLVNVNYGKSIGLKYMSVTSRTFRVAIFTAVSAISDYRHSSAKT